MVTAAGDLIWYGGGKLAPDLTLPKLRLRWPGPGARARQRGCGPARQQARLHGHDMTDGPARAVLRREVSLCAAAARSEPEFFTAPETAGLLVRIRYRPGRPGEAAGYSVSLPGLTHARDGQQVWYGGQTLSSHLALGALRRRWTADRTGRQRPAPPWPGNLPPSAPWQ